ncbi:hypothetical protein C1H46_034634 [Malus baccata]|uniref:Uncharacterized protein n=1 Tax=Malus baccata TaxID=106549 RepID=A0A540KZW3_MALBA|nr:hypothetical protein C1H46_034634 [Malus baccata]
MLNNDEDWKTKKCRKLISWPIQILPNSSMIIQLYKVFALVGECKFYLRANTL